MNSSKKHLSKASLFSILALITACVTTALFSCDSEYNSERVNQRDTGIAAPPPIQSPAIDSIDAMDTTRSDTTMYP